MIPMLPMSPINLELPMSRSKSEFTSVGLDAEGTLRGPLLWDLATDDPWQWPKYSAFQQTSEGRDFRLVATGANTLTIRGVLSLLITGDFTWSFVADDVIDVVNAGGADGQYTVVSSVATTAVIGVETLNVTVITVVETVPASTLNDDSRVSTPEVRWPTWLTYPISSHTTGANGEIVIPNPVLVLPVDSPVFEYDLFYTHDLVRISGSYNGLNDGEAKCIADRDGDVNTPTLTVYTDQFLNAIPTGEAKGLLTIILPPPLREHSGEWQRGVNRAYRTLLRAGTFIQGRRMDQRGDFVEISGTDIASSVPNFPEEL